MFDSSRNVLVTGGTGFLGSYLVASLERSGARVHIVSRSNNHFMKPSIRWHQADLKDIKAARRLAAQIQPDLVFHLCSHGFGTPDIANVLPTFHNDLMTAVNMLSVVSELKIRRLVLAASLEEPRPTDAKIVPATPYAAAKWAASAYAQMFHRLYNTPVVMVRPFMTYGPGQPEHKIVPYVILSTLKGDRPVLSSGKRPIDWIYVDDVIEGMLAAAQAPGVEGTTIDLGSGTLVPIKSLVETVERIVGCRARPLYSAFPDKPRRVIRAADTELAYSLLRWKPTTSLEDGLRQTVDWYRSFHSRQILQPS